MPEDNPNMERAPENPPTGFVVKKKGEPLTVHTIKAPTGSENVHPQNEPGSGKVEIATQSELFRSKIEGKSFEEQLEVVRPILESIENKLERIKTQSDKASILIDNLDIMDLEVSSEVLARINLHECFLGVQEARKGKPEDFPNNLRTFVTEAKTEGFLLQGENFNRLLVTGMEKMKVREAFYMLQDQAFYKPAGQRTAEQAQVAEQNNIVAGLMARGLSDKEARKSLELAKRVAIATFEDSVWNKDAIPGDPMAEAIYFRKYRLKQDVDMGPKSTIKAISGFGTSFFRQAQDTNKNFLFHGDTWAHIAKPISEGEDTYQREVWTMSVQRIEDEIVSDRRATYEYYALNFGGVDFSQMGEGAYGGFLASYVPGILKVKERLLQENFDIKKDLTQQDINSLFGAFNKADPLRRLALRPLFFHGFIRSALLQGNWDPTEIEKVINRLSSPAKDEDTGQAGYLLTAEEVQWLKNNNKGRISQAAWNTVILSLQGKVQTTR